MSGGKSLGYSLDGWHWLKLDSDPGAAGGLNQLLSWCRRLKQVGVTCVISSHHAAGSVRQRTASIPSSLGAHWHCQLLKTIHKTSFVKLLKSKWWNSTFLLVPLPLHFRPLLFPSLPSLLVEVGPLESSYGPLVWNGTPAEIDFGAFKPYKKYFRLWPI